ncbi:MAG: glutaminyl-peptide cyclotransferase [Caldilineaceae bacterium]|nr:glutaminyl-peptide cyclotransferase [Caldilineaceae bacterium]
MPRLPLATYRVVNEFPHDPTALTQGLIFMDDTLYESTGLRGQSTLRQVDLTTGDVLRSIDLDDAYWGEGMTILGDKIYQLTYKAGVGFVYDKETFAVEREFSYPTEGWGLTTDGVHLIRSDGSSSLYFLDPVTFEEVKRLEVFDDSGAVARLNELEYIDGEIWANIFVTDRIARISPESGEVTGWIDLAGLLPEEKRTQPVDVLNGIAYDDESNRLFVTGKLWPALYEIELVAPGQ